jgi:endoglucanase
MTYHESRRSRLAALVAALFFCAAGAAAQDVQQAAPIIHLNQHGFTPGAPKGATIATDTDAPLAWTLRDATGDAVATGETLPFGVSKAAGEKVHLADFSAYTNEGAGYTLVIGDAASEPFDIAPDIYATLKYDALAFFYHQRSGIAIEEQYAGAEWARPAAHAPDTATCAGPKDHRGNDWGGCPYTLDVSRGWYDAGDHGKYVVNGGITIWTLFNYYERIAGKPGAEDFADGALAIPERGNGVGDLLDEIRWGMDFMLAMQVPDGTELNLPRGDQTGAKKKLKFSRVDASGMVHHKMHDEKWTPLPMPPHLDPETRYLTYPSTAATLNLAAVAAQCARAFRGVDDAYADKCLAAGRRAYAAAKRLPDVLAYDVLDGGGGAYGDKDLADEFYLAAAELYATTGDDAYRDDLTASKHYLAAPAADGTGKGDIFWASVSAPGSLTLAWRDDLLPAGDLEKLRGRLVATADAYLAQSAKDGYRAPFARKYNWGSNADMANRGLILAAAYDFTGDAKYRDGVAAIMDYLLGRNPLGQSYVSGYGEKPMRAPHHRFWARAADPSLPGPPPGVLAGGPNENTSQDPAAKRLTGKCSPQTCYLDDIEAYSLNEVAVNWNAPLFWIAAFLDEEPR